MNVNMLLNNKQRNITRVTQFNFGLIPFENSPKLNCTTQAIVESISKFIYNIWKYINLLILSTITLLQGCLWD